MRTQTLLVRLTPKASSNRIGDRRFLADGREVLCVYVTAPPDRNKANEAMIRLLSAHFDLPPSHIEIVSGHTQRLKTVALTL